jgi:hypothetical protein
MKLSLSGAAGLAFAAVFKALKTLRPTPLRGGSHRYRPKASR